MSMIRSMIRSASGSGGVSPSSDPLSAGFQPYQASEQQAIIDAVTGVAVSNTYYFSQSGNDSTGDGSSSTPWKTAAKAKAIAEASSGGVALLFKRGQVWQEELDLDTIDTKVLVGDYGDGVKPRLTAYSGTGIAASDNAWTNDSGDVWYLTTEPDTLVGTIRLRSDPFNKLTQADTQAKCALLPYSWFQDEEDATFTTNFASDANALNATSHPLSNDDIVYLTTTGTLPTGLSALTNYYVVNATTNAFELSDTQGGSPITISVSNGSGTHTFHHATRLYIHLGSSEDPNDYDLEAVWDANDFRNGVYTASCPLIHYRNIICDGWAVHPTNETARSGYCFSAALSGTDKVFMEGCEAYDGGRHLYQVSSSTGGTLVMKDCAGGYTSVDGTQISPYSVSGGLDTYIDGYRARFGKMPSLATTTKIYPGGPSKSLLTAHTSGGGAKLGRLWLNNIKLEDNREDYSRATYENGELSITDIDGTAYSPSTYKTVINFAPINRLKFHRKRRFTSASNVIYCQDHGFTNGDIVTFTTSGTLPTGLAANEWYAVMNADADTFQVTRRLAPFTANASTDVLTTSFGGYSPVTNDRAMVRSLYGQLPGGLDDTTLYHIVSGSGATGKLSLTSGGAAVDITSAEIGLSILFGQATSVGTSSTSEYWVEGIDLAKSALVAIPQFSLAICQNQNISGIIYGVPSGAVSAYHVNCAYALANVVIGSTEAMQEGSRCYNGFIWLMGLYNTMKVMGGSSINASAQMWNTVVKILNDTSFKAISLNVTNDSDHMGYNAYYDTSNSISSLSSNDPGRVILDHEPEFGVAPTESSQLYEAGLYGAGSLNVGYDQEWNTRPSNPSIGPLEG